MNRLAGKTLCEFRYKRMPARAGLRISPVAGRFVTPQHTSMNPTDQQEQVKWLVDEGFRILHQSATSAHEGDFSSYSGLSFWQRNLLHEQLRLRARAGRRFPDPELWLWTDRSLSQASDWWSAQWKANLVPEQSQIVDACCGAGADLVAFAGRCHRVTGIDRAPWLIELAAANLRHHQLTAELRLCEFPSDDPPLHDESAWLHVDPDRRTTGRKTGDPDQFSPSLREVMTVSEDMAGAIIKLAPSSQLNASHLSASRRSAERVWLGLHGECRQQLLILGDAVARLKQLAAADGWLDENVYASQITRRTAVQVFGAPTPGAVPNYVAFQAGDHRSPAGAVVDSEQELDQFVLDLDNTLHASDLQSAWAERHSLKAISDPKGFYTSTCSPASPWVQSFRVEQVIPWDDRRVRKLLRQLGAGIVEVKTRLVKLDANFWQRRYSTPLGKKYTLLVTRFGNRVRCVVAQRARRKWKSVGALNDEQPRLQPADAGRRLWEPHARADRLPRKSYNGAGHSRFRRWSRS
jgi:hypothetical protein